MIDYQNYHIEDFSVNNYKKLLRLTKEKYSFLNYNKNYESDTNLCLWRHDVDFSIENAYKLSCIEKEMKVQATYFIQLSSNFYNVFDINTLKLIKGILNNNHKVGIHFYSEIYLINNKVDLIRKLSFEKEILETLINTSIDVFSFHNPTKEILIFNETEYSGMLNTYSEYFKENFEYCSDSNGYWRYVRLEDFLKLGHQKIQILTHPVWWQEEEMLPRQRIETQISNQSNFLLKWYDSALESFGRKNIGK